MRVNHDRSAIRQTWQYRFLRATVSGVSQLFGGPPIKSKRQLLQTASGLSRGSSSASGKSFGSSTSSASSVSSLFDQDTMASHFEQAGAVAAAKARATDTTGGLMRPAQRARLAGKAAVMQEKERVTGLLADYGRAKASLIRAQGAERIAASKLRQATVKFGSHSLVAHEARKAHLAAVRAAGAASAELYLADQAI